MQKIIQTTLLLISIMFISACSVTLGNNTGGGGGDNQTTWQSIGPSAPGDVYIYQISTVAFDNTGTLYIGGATLLGGGVWKYSNNEWVRLGTSLDVNVVNTMVIDDNNNIYVSGRNVFSVTNSVYKYSNNIWSLVGNSNVPMGAINSIAVDNSGKVYAGGVDANDLFAAIYTTDNESWVSMGDFPELLYSFSALAIDKTNGKLYAGAVNLFNPAGLWECVNESCDQIGNVSNLDRVNSIVTTSTDKVYLGGKLNTPSDVIAGAVYEYSNNSFTQIGESIPILVKSVNIDNNSNLYAGGHYYDAGYMYQYTNSKWNQIGESMPGEIVTTTVSTGGAKYAAGIANSGGGVVWVYP